MELSIRNFTKSKISSEYLSFVARKTIQLCGYKKKPEISLVIIGTKRMVSLNYKYRKKNKVTDVLSFGNENPLEAQKFIMSPSESINLGEVFICYKQAEKQSRDKKHSIKKEISILLIHGILHLLGFDHSKDEDAKKMQKMEALVLSSL